MYTAREKLVLAVVIVLGIIMMMVGYAGVRISRNCTAKSGVNLRDDYHIVLATAIIGTIAVVGAVGHMIYVGVTEGHIQKAAQSVTRFGRSGTAAVVPASG